MKTSGPTKAFPIEVRYLNHARDKWEGYSRHRSRAAADRAFVELRNAKWGCMVQMRNDFSGEGVLRSAMTS